MPWTVPAAWSQVWVVSSLLGDFWVHCTEDVSLEGDCLILQAFGKALAAGCGFLIPTHFRKLPWPTKLSVVRLSQAVWLLIPMILLWWSVPSWVSFSSFVPLQAHGHISLLQQPALLQTVFNTSFRPWWCFRPFLSISGLFFASLLSPLGLSGG